MTVIDNTVKAEGLGSFYKNLVRRSVKAGRKIAIIVLKNRERALEITSNIATAAATRNSKDVISTLPEVINIFHTGRGFYLGKFVYYMLNKGSKKHRDPNHLHR